MLRTEGGHVEYGSESVAPAMGNLRNRSRLRCCLNCATNKASHVIPSHFVQARQARLESLCLLISQANLSKKKQKEQVLTIKQIT